MEAFVRNVTWASLQSFTGPNDRDTTTHSLLGVVFGIAVLGQVLSFITAAECCVLLFFVTVHKLPILLTLEDFQRHHQPIWSSHLPVNNSFPEKENSVRFPIPSSWGGIVPVKLLLLMDRDSKESSSPSSVGIVPIK